MRQFGSAREVLAQDALAEIETLVLDLSLPDGDGLSVLDVLTERHPHLPIVVLTMHDAPAFARDALLRGACGFVSKRAAADELPEALAAAGRGERYVSRSLDDRLDLPPSQQLPSLTAREHEVFVRLARGEQPNDIAETLGITSKTVYVHRTSLMDKLDAKNEVDLYRIARWHGLVE